MARQTERLASETIWSNGAVIIPMCDVQHITRHKFSPTVDFTEGRHTVFVVMKSGNEIGFDAEDGERFIASYCDFRGEIDPVMDHTQMHDEKPFAKSVDRCEACAQLAELYNGVEVIPGRRDVTSRQYWLMTELFVKLHGGKDTCEVIAP